MKKIVFIVLVLTAVCLTFAACNNKDQENGTTVSTTASIVTTEIVTTVAQPIEDLEPSVFSGKADKTWYNEKKTEFVIKSADQFMGFLNLRADDKTFEGKTVSLACDVILNKGTKDEIFAKGAAANLIPQLNSANVFRGTFDGRGHSIEGAFLYCSNAGFKSMFGTLGNHAVIKDVSFVNCCVSGPNVESKVGVALIGTKTADSDAEITLSDISVDCIVKEHGAAVSSIGFLIGRVEEGKSITIRNCSTTGSAAITGTKLGGLIGEITGKNTTVVLENCQNGADLTAAKYCGGMIGTEQAKSVTLTNCVNTGKINCRDKASDMIGSDSTDDILDDCEPLAAAPAGTANVRVMSFNIQTSLSKKSDGTLTDAAKNRMAAVLQEIKNNDPMFVGLQEDNETWVKYLQNGLTDYEVICDSGITSSGERDAIFYKKGLPIVGAGYFWLTSSGLGDTCALTIKDLTTDGSPYRLSDAHLETLYLSAASSDSELITKHNKYISKSTGQEVAGSVTYLGTRRMTYAVFDFDGQKILYVNTHLQHRSPNEDYYNKAFETLRGLERICEYDIMQTHVDELLKKYPDAYVIITGDFNNGDNGEIYLHAVKDYADSYKLTEKSVGNAPGSWNDAFDLSLQGDNYPSKLEGTGTGRLDYCFVTPGKFRVLRFKSGAGKATITAQDGTVKTIYTSDHLPQTIDLNFAVPGSSEPVVTDVSVYNGVPDKSWYTGDKTEYTLNTASQLMGFIHLRAAQVSFKGVTIKLGADMIINEGTLDEIIARGSSNYSWIELNSAYTFCGTFDGQGHTVSGLYLQCGANGVRGMLGSAGDGAVVKDFSLINSYYGTPTATGKNSIGGIFSKIVSGSHVTISNVRVYCVIKEGPVPFNRAAGFVATVESNSDVTMDRCVYEGTITITGSYAAALIANAHSTSQLHITNCENKGTITASSNAADLYNH